MFEDISIIRPRTTGRASSWDTTGRNADSWEIAPGETRVLADVRGRGRITHIWMTQPANYRECLLRMTWDDAPHPSVEVPLGDFFCLGHGIVASHQSALFSTSTRFPYQFNMGCALNCHIPMPFRERAVIELVNQGGEPHRQYFYVNYELCDDLPAEAGYLHAEFRRANPFGGWGPEMASNRPGSHLTDVPNTGRAAWDHNYLILETRGRGHYIGCNLSVTNFRADWWGEGDDMIWVDGYKWPPDLHGTGTEDYLGQAWGMQDNAFLRCGSSVFEGRTLPQPSTTPWDEGGYQTSYVWHLENPVRFNREIRVTIEHGHANHLGNEMASTAYWFAAEPTRVAEPPPVERRMPAIRNDDGTWTIPPSSILPGTPVPPTQEMLDNRRRWNAEFDGE